MLVYVQDDIPSKLLNISYVSSDTERLAIGINLQSGYLYVHTILRKIMFQIIRSDTPLVLVWNI